jgi:hypothetical protein
MLMMKTYSIGVTDSGSSSRHWHMLNNIYIYAQPTFKSASSIFEDPSAISSFKFPIRIQRLVNHLKPCLAIDPRELRVDSKSNVMAAVMLLCDEINHASLELLKLSGYL